MLSRICALGSPTLMGAGLGILLLGVPQADSLADPVPPPTTNDCKTDPTNGCTKGTCSIPANCSQDFCQCNDEL